MKEWMKNIRNLEPYVPGEQPKDTDIIKLNTNENPYPPAPGVTKAAAALNTERLRLYPDPTVSLLTAELAGYYHVDPDQVFVGVGSDDVLATAFMTFFNAEKPILFPNITYSFYDVWAKLFKIPYEQLDLNKDFNLVKEDYYKENGGVIFPNPNAPTGLYEDLGTVEDIIKHNQDIVVIIDEAYIDFGGKSALELISKYDNLLVIQTFSKSRSMAGIRIGFAIGNPQLIKALNDVKFSFNSYTINMPSILLGVAAVKDKGYFEETIQKVIDTREIAKQKLSQLGFTFPDSKANFIFAAHKTISAITIQEYLKSKNIYVRYFNAPGIDNYLRISIGTDKEMEQLYQELEGLLNGNQ